MFTLMSQGEPETVIKIVMWFFQMTLICLYQCYPLGQYFCKFDYFWSSCMKWSKNSPYSHNENTFYNFDNTDQFGSNSLNEPNTNFQIIIWLLLIPIITSITLIILITLISLITLITLINFLDKIQWFVACGLFKFCTQMNPHLLAVW